MRLTRNVEGMFYVDFEYGVGSLSLDSGLFFFSLEKLLTRTRENVGP